MAEILKIGSTGEAVKELQQLLRSQGFFTYAGDKFGEFGASTERGVLDFQVSHLDDDGEWLDVDGIVGPKTQWALEHPSGEEQRSFINAALPDGITGGRARALAQALGFWRQNVHEDPDGANSGDGVDQFIAGYGPVPWCMLFVSHIDLASHNGWALGEREASTYKAYQKADRLGILMPKEGYTPIPGDWFLIQYRDAKGNLKGTGHVGYVLRVSEDGRVYQTVEGNCGNRVKVGERKISQSTLVGFVNRYKDGAAHPAYERGLCERLSHNVESEGTR